MGPLQRKRCFISLLQSQTFCTAAHLRLSTVTSCDHVYTDVQQTQQHLPLPDPFQPQFLPSDTSRVASPQDGRPPGKHNQLILRWSHPGNTRDFNFHVGHSRQFWINLNQSLVDRFRAFKSVFQKHCFKFKRRKVQWQKNIKIFWNNHSLMHSNIQ